MKTPTYYLQFKRSGRTWGFSQKVTNFTFKDSEDELDELSLAGEDSRLILLDHPDLLDDGKTEVHFKYGYAGNMSEKRVCVITQLTPDFPSDGAITIDIVAHDKGAKMTDTEVSKVWRKGGGIYISDVATSLASKYGLNAVVEPTKWKYDTLTQSQQTDMDFLRELSKEAISRDSSKKGVYRVYVENNTLYFKPMDLESPPIVEYTYYTDRKAEFISFSPGSNTQLHKGDGSEVTYTFIDDKVGTKVQQKSNNKNTSRTTLGKETLVPESENKEAGMETGNIQGIPEVVTSFDSSQASVVKRMKDKTEVTFKNAEIRTVEATMVVEGNPWIKAKNLIKVNGVGKKYSGLWYIVEVTHDIGMGGYTTTLKLQRNALGSSGEGEKVKNSKPNKYAKSKTKKSVKKVSKKKVTPPKSTKKKSSSTSNKSRNKPKKPKKVDKKGIKVDYRTGKVTSWGDVK